MAEETEQTNGSNKLLKIGGGALVALLIVGFAGWYFLIRDDSAASVNSESAAEERAAALDEAAAADNEPADAGGDAATTEDAAAPAAGLDGQWTVDTSIGTFDDRCLTEVCGAAFVGFRIDEELANIGAKTVVGRTPGVSGTLEIQGTTITTTDIQVDMTQLITDSSARTNAIRSQAIETAAFPEASFTLTSPIELGALPADGEQVQVEATGDLTIHGVTRSETIPLTAELAGDTIVVFGELGPILLDDYNIGKPTAAVVLSVEEDAIMELQLFFTR